MTEYGAWTTPQSRRRHYFTVIAENNDNPKELRNTFRRILHKTIILPDHLSPTDLTNIFGHFFSDKIMKVRLAPVCLQEIAFYRICTPENPA